MVVILQESSCLQSWDLEQAQGLGKGCRPRISEKRQDAWGNLNPNDEHFWVRATVAWSLGKGLRQLPTFGGAHGPQAEYTETSEAQKKEIISISTA